MVLLNDAPDDPPGRVNKGMSIWAVWFSFSGRINRKTYWLKGILLPIGIIVGLFLAGAAADMFSQVAGDILWYLVLAAFLAFIVTSLAVSVKRLHDRNRTGWWILTTYIPVVGIIVGIWFFVELGFLKGDSWPNRYGDVP